MTRRLSDHDKAMRADVRRRDREAAKIAKRDALDHDRACSAVVGRAKPLVIPRPRTPIEQKQSPRITLNVEVLEETEPGYIEVYCTITSEPPGTLSVPIVFVDDPPSRS